MAHLCWLCGSECYCNGSIDDAVVDKTPKNCVGCGCEGMLDDEPYFEGCSNCDGHDACADYGCAYENGCGHLVNKEIGGFP